MNNDSFIEVYIEECMEHLSTVENDILTMEKNGKDVDQELVNRVFRAAHSIKGGAGFFELTSVKELAHKLENVLDMIRTEKLVPNPEIVNQLLNGFDKLRLLLKDPEQRADADVSEEVVALTGLVASYLPAGHKSAAAESRNYPVPRSTRQLQAGAILVDSAREEGKGIAVLRFDLIHDVQRLGKTPLSVMTDLEAGGIVLDCLLEVEGVGDLDSDSVADSLPFYVLYATHLSVVEIARNIDLPTSGITFFDLPKPASPAAKERAPEPKPAAAPVTKGEDENQEKRPHRDEGESSVRIPVAVLDKLMNQASELVLSRNELLEAIRSRSEVAIKNVGRRIDLVTREVQESVMLTRMQPIDNLFSRYPRIVRDLSKKVGKKIELSLFGREVEIDKTILELLSDPLTHLLRNAVDHGIESETNRVAAGKPPSGTIKLKAQHEAGKVMVEIADDGAGIDLVAVAKKALSLKLVTQERLDRMNEKEKAALILLPGLSTAEKLTDISGRGVGMDVVKTNIDRLGGQIEIITERKRGTSFRIKLPLTLAIIPSLLVSVQERHYAIPEANVEELLKLRPEDVKNRLEVIADRTYLVLRGSLIPVVRLTEVLGLTPTFVVPDTGERSPDHRRNLADRRGHPVEGETLLSRSGSDRRYHADSDFPLVVVNSNSLRYALVVEALDETMEIVVKPLGSHFTALREFSGATVLGNGATALILDTTGIALKAGLSSSDSRDQTGSEQGESDSAGETFNLLTFGNGPRERCAIPLEKVDRVVRISWTDLDRIGSARVLTRDDKVFPVFSLNDSLELCAPLEESGELQCILASIGGHSFGILATAPIDSIATEVSVDDSGFAGIGVKGTFVFKEKSVLMIDLEGFVGTLKPEWFQSSGRLAAASGARVLVVDDSPFFRSKVAGILMAQGYQVLEAGDGVEALALFRANGDIAAMVTDLEMPLMDGLELTRKVRATPSLIPIVALTSLASEHDHQAGMEAGVSAFQVKLDEAELLDMLRKLLENRPA